MVYLTTTLIFFLDNKNYVLPSHIAYERMKAAHVLLDGVTLVIDIPLTVSFTKSPLCVD